MDHNRANTSKRDLKKDVDRAVKFADIVMWAVLAAIVLILGSITAVLIVKG
jgi:hypothetical protein